MPQLDSNLLKTGTVFPDYPSIKDVDDRHVLERNQDNTYGLELEDVTAAITRAREYRINMNPFGQRTVVKQEFLYDNEKREAVGEKYRFVPNGYAREIDADKLAAFKWEPLTKGNYGKAQLIRFTVRIGAAVLFLFLISVVFNWFIQGPWGARFLYNQTLKSYQALEYQEIEPSVNMAEQLSSQLMEQEHFVLYDYTDEVTVQKRGDMLLFDMGEQGRLTYDLSSEGETDAPIEFLKQYFVRDNYSKQRVIHQYSGDAYILEGESVLLYYPEGAFISGEDRIVKILFREMKPIF